MDYNNVNNPFITLRNHKTEEEFTVDLSKDIPSVENNANMSNMKKSNHALYSDNRANKMRWGDDVKTFGNYEISLVDIDNIIYEYFTKVINPTVVDANNTMIKVPVRHASPERWSAIQSDGAYRDEKGQLQRPVIIFTRTNVSRDDSFLTFNKYLTTPFVKKFSSKNSYDRLSILNQAQPLQEIHNVTFPDHVVLTYDFNMNTEYVQQMNQLVETINFAENDYWGDPARFKFRASIDSFSNSVEVSSDDDRSVSSTFTVTVHSYLLPLVFDNKTNVNRGLSTRKVIWGAEATSDAMNPYTEGKPYGHTKKELIQSKRREELSNEKRFILNRKNKKVYLKKSDKKSYIIRLWKDDEMYVINVDGRNFILDVKDKDKIIWDAGATEVDLTPNLTFNVRIPEVDFVVNVNEDISILQINFTE